MLRNIRRKRSRDRLRMITGFTLIEVLIVMAMVGVLSAIAAPSWSGFINSQRLNSAQSRAFSTLRLAQSNAKREQIIWQATFRNTPNAAQYVIHKIPTSTSATNADYWNSLPWQSFDEGVRIVENTENEPRTTLLKLTNGPEPNVYRVQFKPQGNVNGQLGKITFGTINGDRKKCVIISTLLGSIRLAENSGCK